MVFREGENMNVNEYTKNELLELYRTIKNFAPRYQSILRENCPEVTRLEKDILDLEVFLLEVMEVNFDKDEV